MVKYQVLLRKYLDNDVAATVTDKENIDLRVYSNRKMTGKRKQRSVKNNWREVCEAWVDGRVESRPGVNTPVSELYNAYIADNPNNYMDIGQFGKVLRSRYPNGKCRRGKQGEQLYAYQNVAIKPLASPSDLGRGIDGTDSRAFLLGHQLPSLVQPHMEVRTNTTAARSSTMLGAKRKSFEKTDNTMFTAVKRMKISETGIPCSAMLDKVEGKVADKRKGQCEAQQAVPEPDNFPQPHPQLSYHAIEPRPPPLWYRAIKLRPPPPSLDTTQTCASPLNHTPTPPSNHTPTHPPNHTSTSPPNYTISPPPCHNTKLLASPPHNLIQPDIILPDHSIEHVIFLPHPSSEPGAVLPHYTDEPDPLFIDDDEKASIIFPDQPSKLDAIIPDHTNRTLTLPFHIPAILPDHTNNTLTPPCHTTPSTPLSHHKQKCKSKAMPLLIPLSKYTPLHHLMSPATTKPHTALTSKAPNNLGLDSSTLPMQRDITLCPKTKYRMALARHWVDDHLTHMEGASIGAEDIWQAYCEDNPDEPIPATSMAIIVRGKYPNRKKLYIQDNKPCYYYQDLLLVRNQNSATQLLYKRSENTSTVDLKAPRPPPPVEHGSLLNIKLNTQAESCQDGTSDLTKSHSGEGGTRERVVAPGPSHRVMSRLGILGSVSSESSGGQSLSHQGRKADNSSDVLSVVEKKFPHYNSSDGEKIINHSDSDEERGSLNQSKLGLLVQGDTVQLAAATNTGKFVVLKTYARSQIKPNILKAEGEKLSLVKVGNGKYVDTIVSKTRKLNAKSDLDGKALGLTKISKNVTVPVANPYPLLENLGDQSAELPIGKLISMSDQQLSSDTPVSGEQLSSDTPHSTGNSNASLSTTCMPVKKLVLNMSLAGQQLSSDTPQSTGNNNASLSTTCTLTSAHKQVSSVCEAEVLKAMSPTQQHSLSKNNTSDSLKNCISDSQNRINEKSVGTIHEGTATPSVGRAFPELERDDSTTAERCKSKMNSDFTMKENTLNSSTSIDNGYIEMPSNVEKEYIKSGTGTSVSNINSVLGVGEDAITHTVADGNEEMLLIDDENRPQTSDSDSNSISKIIISSVYTMNDNSETPSFAEDNSEMSKSVEEENDTSQNCTLYLQSTGKVNVKTPIKKRCTSIPSSASGDADMPITVEKYISTPQYLTLCSLERINHVSCEREMGTLPAAVGNMNVEVPVSVEREMSPPLPTLFDLQNKTRNEPVCPAGSGNLDMHMLTDEENVKSKNSTSCLQSGEGVNTKKKKKCPVIKKINVESLTSNLRSKKKAGKQSRLRIDSVYSLHGNCVGESGVDNANMPIIFETQKVVPQASTSDAQTHICIQTVPNKKKGNAIPTFCSNTMQLPLLHERENITQKDPYSDVQSNTRIPSLLTMKEVAVNQLVGNNRVGVDTEKPISEAEYTSKNMRNWVLVGSDKSQSNASNVLLKEPCTRNKLPSSLHGMTVMDYFVSEMSHEGESEKTHFLENFVDISCLPDSNQNQPSHTDSGYLQLPRGDCVNTNQNKGSRLSKGDILENGTDADPAPPPPADVRLIMVDTVPAPDGETNSIHKNNADSSVKSSSEDTESNSNVDELRKIRKIKHKGEEREEMSSTNEMKKLKSWDEDIRRFTFSSEYDWYKEYQSSRPKTMKTNKSACEKSDQSSATPEKRRAVEPSTVLPTSPKTKTKDVNNAASNNGSSSQASSGEDLVTNNAFVATHTETRTPIIDTGELRSLKGITRGSKDINHLNIKEKKICNLYEVMSSCGIVQQEEIRTGSGSGVGHVKVQEISRNITKAVDNPTDMPQIKPTIEDSAKSHRAMEMEARNMKGDKSSDSLIIDMDNAIELDIQVFTEESIERENCTENIKLHNKMDNIVEKGSKSSYGMDDNSFLESMVNLSDSQSNASLVIDLDENSTSGCVEVDDANLDKSKLSEPVEELDMEVFSEESNENKNCTESIELCHKMVDTIKKGNEVESVKSPVCILKKNTKSYETRAGKTGNENNVEKEQIGAEKVREAVLRAAISVLSDKGLTMNMTERARQLESSLLWENPAVTYSTTSGPNQFSCTSSASLKALEDYSVVKATSLILHHQSCPGLGCKKCSVLRAAYIHIALFRHKCCVWQSFAAVVDRHALTCRRYSCSVIFCHFMKHGHFMNNIPVLNGYSKSNKIKILRDFIHCQELGPHSTSFICNKLLTKIRPSLLGSNNSVSREVKLMIQLVMPEEKDNCDDFLEPIFETFQVAANLSNNKSDNMCNELSDSAYQASTSDHS